MKDFILRSYTDGLELLNEFINNPQNIEKTVKISEIIAESYKSGNKVIICGNGGSAADAIHFAEELTGKYRDERPALPALSITDPGHITCVGNDFGFDAIFSRGVEAHGKKGDVFIGLSTSGNSSNIIRAIDTAKEIGMKTISLLGKDGGKIKKMCNFEFVVEGKTSDRIQEIHMMILHIIIEGVERILFPDNY